jgi:site-specific DNA-methyltransferase (adenine-specific)
MKEMEDGCVDLTVTSCPYDNLRTYDGIIDTWNFDKFKDIAKELYRVTADGGVVVWVIGDSTVKGSETGTSFRQALYFMELGFKLHDTMIWNKGSFAFPSKGRYHQVFEYMFVFSKGAPKAFNPIKDRENKYVGTRGASGRKANGERNTGKSEVREKWGQRFNIWNYPIGGGHSASDKIAFEHPAIFPEKLAEDHILSWSNEGDVVFDPFMGSGTTGKMAILNNRHFVGIELNEDYFEISKKRIEMYKGEE